MKEVTEFTTRDELDASLAKSVSEILSQAILSKGKASIAVSGGSTPKGFFSILSKSKLDWSKVTVTLADERWVPFDSQDSNTRLVHDSLLQNEASKANFFHLKEGDDLTEQTLNKLNLTAEKTILPFDVLILGMGEDGHTASLFPCSDEISYGLDLNNNKPLLKVSPKTAPHLRISFSFVALSHSKNVFLHLCGENKKTVLNKAFASQDAFEMPIRAFLNHPSLNTQIYWAP